MWRCITFGLLVWAPEICLLDTPLGPRRDDSFVYSKVQALGNGPAVVFFTGEGDSAPWISRRVSLKSNKAFTQRWSLLVCKATLAPNMPSGKSQILDWQFLKEKSSLSFPYRALCFLGHETSLKSYHTVVVKDCIIILLRCKGNDYDRKL